MSLPAITALTCAGRAGRKRRAGAAGAAGCRAVAADCARTGLCPRPTGQLVARLAELTRPAGCRLLVNAQPDWLAGWPVDGVHLNSAAGRLPPAPGLCLGGASAHRPEELQHAAELGLDYALLGRCRHRQPPGRAAAGLARPGLPAGQRRPASAGVRAGGLAAADLPAAQKPALMAWR